MGKHRSSVGRAVAILVAVATLAPPVSTAVASSPDAWAEFAADVKARCLREARKNSGITNPSVKVDPYGSQSYGVAIITSRQPNKPTETYVCVYDKRTKQAELAGPLES